MQIAISVICIKYIKTFDGASLQFTAGTENTCSWHSLQNNSTIIFLIFKKAHIKKKEFEDNDKGPPVNYWS